MLISHFAIALVNPNEYKVKCTDRQFFGCSYKKFRQTYSCLFHYLRSIL